MDPIQFINKWRQSQLSERAAAQEHFLDLCALVGHPSPAEHDPTGESFTFERGAAKHGGGDGWADVWKRGCFGWEYKGKHKDLAAAYDQLLLYREALENPPLLVVCDMDRIIVHTNFTAVANQTHEISLETLGEPRSLEIIRAVFFEPEKLKPGRTSEAVTQKAAEVFAGLAGSLRARGVAPDVSAHFLDRIVFALFAEGIGLLPDGLFTAIIRNAVPRPAAFPEMAAPLFRAMAQGGFFGAEPIRHFNGSLFEDATALELTADELRQVLSVTGLDWSAVDVSIFGTLFERGMDPAKRAQLGAHYTGRQDIELIVDPVIMQPLRAEWATIRDTVTKRLAAAGNSKARNKTAVLRDAKAEGYSIVGAFLQKLAHVKVLDPACGSGNFLYVTLQKLKDLEKEVILFAIDHDLGAFLPTVGPWQLYGIEVNPYAYDLALMTVWIGYLQWVKANGFGFPNDPILHKLEGNFRCMDAILDLTDPADPREPEWPRVDFIVGNPPFLGDKMMRRELGGEYVDKLRSLYAGRIPGQSDLCCYWFERARSHLAAGACKRVGLLATQGIRGRANRTVLERIKSTGNIFFAESDRPWVLNGANVHVSMIGFDDGSQTERWLDGQTAVTIQTNLATEIDTTAARGLPENEGLSFLGASMHGPFAVATQTAHAMLCSPNPHGRPNSNVVRPWANGLSITAREWDLWAVDFPLGTDEHHAALYEAPFEHVQRNVRPVREKNHRAAYARYWWLYGEPRQGMHAALRQVSCYAGTARVAKHRLFVRFPMEVLPTDQVVVFVRSDDYFLGVLHSRLHELWALKQGTHLETRPRYTPTTCFETFPFPWAPGAEPAGDPRVQAIANAARALCELRSRWLNPPEWTKTEVLEFPATVGGLWDRYIVGSTDYAPADAEPREVHDPPPSTPWGRVQQQQLLAELKLELEPPPPPKPPVGSVGLARYPRLLPKDADSAALLARRTLTNLYNQRPEWLATAQRHLDEAVAAAYGWPADMSDSTILEKLLALNLERAGAPPANR